jgi:hypothetical protein
MTTINICPPAPFRAQFESLAFTWFPAVWLIALFGPAEAQQMLDWAGAAFAGAPRSCAQPAVRVELVRQEHNVLRFGQSCMETPVSVDLPGGTRALTLKVDSTPDGPGSDQADWADARIVLADNREVWAVENRMPPRPLAMRSACRPDQADRTPSLHAPVGPRSKTGACSA